MVPSNHIMVIDDEEELANLFGIYLNNNGFESTIFTNPLQALEHYKQNHCIYSIVIIDFKMPHINGLELAKKIRETSYNVKIVLVTAYSIQKLMQTDEFSKAKISAVLIKPIRLSDFKSRLNEILFEPTSICC